MNAWWRGPLCISDVQFTPDKLRKLGPDGAATILAELGFNVHEQAFPALPGYEGSYLRAPWTPEEYKAFINACHARGIRVTPYLNIHGFYVELADEHLDWPQRLPDGKLALQGNGRWVPPCYNSPWRDFALNAIGALAQEYPIDGIFLDGPALYYRTCYCEHCRKIFQQTNGRDLPAWDDWNDPAWPAFLRFREESLVRLLSDIRKQLDAARPGEHLVLYMNNESLTATWLHARRTSQLSPYLDVLGNERALIFTTPPPLAPLWMVGAAVKILETQAKQGQPTVQYCCFRHLPWDYYGLPADEYRVYVAGALANGAHPQVMGGWRYLDKELQAVVRDLNRLQRENPDVFCGTRSAANVALLWPQCTADFGGVRTPMLATTQARIYPPPLPGSPPATTSGAVVVQEEFYGWAEALMRGGIPYDILDDAALVEDAETLTRYQAIILPSAQCLSDACCSALKEYVRRGRHLIATGTSSLCDEWDQPRQDFALADVFGASYAGRLIGPLPIDYLEIASDARSSSATMALLADITHNVIPAPPSAVAVRSKTAFTLAVHLHKLLTRYEPLQREEVPQAAALVNRYGEGSCVFLPGAFGSAYWQHHFADYRRFMLNALLWRCEPPMGLRLALKEGSLVGSSPPETVEVSWRRSADGRWLLHLVNHTGMMSRPIEQLLPLLNVQVVLPALASARQLRARALVSRADLAVDWDDRVPWLRLPRLEAYEVIVLSTEGAA
jgi:hypothetical protein